MAFKVLIIEDDFVIQMFLENIIRNMGYVVVGTAENGDDGIELTLQHSPDVVLLDIGIIGNKDGIETAKIIGTNKTPVVFVTGNSDKETMNRALKTNPIHIVRKPIDEEMLKKELLHIYDKVMNLKKKDPSTNDS